MAVRRKASLLVDRRRRVHALIDLTGQWWVVLIIGRCGRVGRWCSAKYLDGARGRLVIMCLMLESSSWCMERLVIDRVDVDLSVGGGRQRSERGRP